MVKSLYGLVDGQQIVFERNGDVWETTIPADLDGTYIVELWAVDEAGNVGYRSDYIITIDLASLCVHLVPYDKSAEKMSGQYLVHTESREYCATICENEYRSESCLSPYYATVIKPECEVRL